MSEIFTPTPIELDDILIPSDGDLRNVASVNGPMKKLGNGILFEKERIDNYESNIKTSISIATLTAINTTTLDNQTVRNTEMGLYVYNALIDPPVGEDPADYAPWMVAPTTGPGSWILSHPSSLGQYVDVPLFPQGLAEVQVGSEMTADFTLIPTLEGPLFTILSRKGSTFKFTDVAELEIKHFGTSVDLSPYLAPLAGLKLGSATLYLHGVAAHAGLPNAMPSFGILVSDLINGTVDTMRTDNLAVVDPSASVGAYELHHNITLIAQKNARISRATPKAYTAVIFDEGALHALPNTIYWGIRLNLTL